MATKTALYNVACNTINKELFDCRMIGIESTPDGSIMFDVFDGWDVVGCVLISDDYVRITYPFWEKSGESLQFGAVDEDDIRDILLSVFDRF